MESQIIVFDGVDKSGKSTLKKEFDKATNYFHWTVDRGPVSHIAYNIIYNRYDQNNILEIINICPKIILVYCCTAPNIIEKRISTAPTEPEINVKKDIHTFDTVVLLLANRFKKIYRINTGLLDLDNSIIWLVNKLEQDFN
jgi:thymidylate kinase